MKFLVVLPENNYYLWQMIVQMNNLKKLGYDGDTIYVIGKSNYVKGNILNNIIRNHKTKCSIHVYDDNRVDNTYSPAMTAHVLSKFFEDFPEYEKETFFYIDPDVIFKNRLNFNGLLNNDTWYMSDTRSYIDSKYIKSKGLKIFHEMCNIVGIDHKIVEANDENAGGAQILMKNLTAEYWRKVERDSISLYRAMEKTKTGPMSNVASYNFIQSWTAEMWAVLWNGWLMGHETKIIKRFNFCWATDPILKWERMNIYHNAGAVNSENGHFVKTQYQKSPFKQDIKCSDQFCGYRYVEEIKEAEKNFENIIF